MIVPLSRFSALMAAMSVAMGGCAESTGTPDPVPIERTTFAPSLGVNLAASTRTSSGVYYRDIRIGTGPVILVGQKLEVRYTGWLANGQQFASRTGADTFFFGLGSGDVIRGWDEGIPGMRVFGKRQLVIPPERGYGAFGVGSIPANAVLVFDIEVLSAR